MRNGNVTLRSALAIQTSLSYAGGPDVSGPVTIGMREMYRCARISPTATAAIVFITPLRGWVMRAKSEFWSMFSTTIDPKMKGTVTSVKKAIGKVTGDAKLQSDGKAEQAEGKIQNAVGGLKDTVREIVKE